ncbi:hypothetical protein BDQ94DRAFT_134536 [Aspergillus welwitschiae]|uniref:Uncharacterized protein n=1 Tax=Aspergillus welwitschiae TaxID=1341132 RepID=A0A3F3QHU1_9EURO|nr:hypothetical protein BDQ94DRAFT_134536 [Aspergillus welwitschiae]RDH38751.1 hypothetical protein BDQ94DRAFT_134536 [Aspergillus welwitschiae]
MASLSSFDRRVNNPRCSFSTNGCLCPSLRPSARVTKRPKDSHQPQFSHLDSGCRMGLGRFETEKRRGPESSSLVRKLRSGLVD